MQRPRPATRIYAWQLLWSGEVDRARELIHEVRGVVEARNDAEGEATALFHLGFLEWRAGNWDEAERCATDAVELFAQLGRLIPPLEFPAAIVAAHRGRIAEARASAQRAVAFAEAEGIEGAGQGDIWLLGFVELSTTGGAPLPEALVRPV